jgi:hypothetical protein
MERVNAEDSLLEVIENEDGSGHVVLLRIAVVVDDPRVAALCDPSRTSTPINVRSLMAN